MKTSSSGIFNLLSWIKKEGWSWWWWNLSNSAADPLVSGCNQFRQEELVLSSSVEGEAKDTKKQYTRTRPTKRCPRHKTNANQKLIEWPDTSKNKKGLPIEWTRSNGPMPPTLGCVGNIKPYQSWELSSAQLSTNRVKGQKRRELQRVIPGYGVSGSERFKTIWVFNNNF